MSDTRLDVRSKRVPMFMLSGPYNATPFSSTVVTIIDKTERALPVVNTGAYTVFVPMVAPKGITNEIVTLEGSDVLNKYNDLFGKPNTVLYGKSSTYAWQAVRSGFNVAVVNVRPVDATYPNFFVNFTIEKTPVKTGEEDKAKQKLFVRKYEAAPSDASLRQPKTKYGYHFAMVPAGATDEEIAKAKASIGKNDSGKPEDDSEIKEIKLATYDFGFNYFNLTGMMEGAGITSRGKGIGIDTNFGEILKTEAMYPKKSGNKYANKAGETTIMDGGSPRDLRADEAEMIAESTDRTEIHPLTPGVKVSFNLEANKVVSLPVFGLVYRGAGDYGNRFVAEFSTKSSPLPIDRDYPYFRCNIRENAYKSEHSFDFTLFSIGKNGYNYNFMDRANQSCRVIFSERNHNNTFTPFLVSRKDSNSIEKGLKVFFEKLRNDLVTELGKVYTDDEAKFKSLLTNKPELDEDTVRNFNTALLGELDTLESDFKRNTLDPEKRSLETPFSRIAPWDLNPIDQFTKKYRRKTIPFLNLLNLPTVIKFDGGDNGCIRDILGEEEFDWDATVYSPYVFTEEDKEKEEAAVKAGKRGTYKVWLDLFTKVYTGEIDDAIFDSTIVRDSIVFGDGYPFELQQTVANLVKYHENWVHREKTRPDWTFIRTPEEEVVTMEDGLMWAQQVLRENKTKNYGMHSAVGSWMFTDPTTGGSNRFSGFFEYLGDNSSLFNYLLSGTSDSFASGDHSLIFNGADGTQECIPRTTEEKTDLCKADVMYFRRRSNGQYGLGEDLGHNPGMLSSLKNLGTCIHFNRILNEAAGFMMDNVISNTDKDTLDWLKKGIEKRISPYTKHFKDRVVVNVKISDHENEQDLKVILAEITTVGHEYSRNNRVSMIMTSENFQ